MAREISRQTFLRGAAGALAAGTVFGSVRATAEPIATGWDALSATIGNPVLLPDNGAIRHGEAGFQHQLQRVEPGRHRHAEIALTDVQKAMTFAAANKLKVAPRSGGHSYTGASTANGAMVFDLRQLAGGINYDAASGRVTTPPATSLYDLHQTLAAAGRGIPTGICPSVGAAGHALGGGLGAQSRHAGLLSRRADVGNGDIAGGSGGDGVRRREPRPVLGVARRWRRKLRGDNIVDLRHLPDHGRRRGECPLSARVVRPGPRRLADLAAHRRPEQLGTGGQHHRRDGYALSDHGDLPCRLG